MKKGIKAKDIRDFEKYANKLNDVINRIREYNPEVNVFAGQEELYLFSGNHINDDASFNYDSIVTSVTINRMDSGAF